MAGLDLAIQTLILQALARGCGMISGSSRGAALPTFGPHAPGAGRGSKRRCLDRGLPARIFETKKPRACAARGFHEA
jgi:hypothetical protein